MTDTKLKTLGELWKENGEKPGLMVINSSKKSVDGYVVVMGQAKNGGFYGYKSWGQSWCLQGDEDSQTWKLHKGANIDAKTAKCTFCGRTVTLIKTNAWHQCSHCTWWMEGSTN